VYDISALQYATYAHTQHPATQGLGFICL